MNYKNNENKGDLNKINLVFEYAKDNKLTFVDQDKKSKKQNNSSGTWNDYCETMKRYERWLQKEHGLKDITRAKPRHAEEYLSQMIQKHENKERGGSAWTINHFIHSLHALQSLARDSGVFKGLKLGKKEKLLQIKNDKGITRKYTESKAMKATSADFENVQQEILNSNSPQKHLIAEIHQIQRGVGCRISEAVKLKPEDITFNNNGFAVVYIKGKGGLERWVNVKDQKTVNLLRERTANVKKGTELYHTKNRKGNDKTRAATIKQIQDVVSDAAERAGVGGYANKSVSSSNQNKEKGKSNSSGFGGESGATYNTHSARKVFAQEEMDKYYMFSERQLKRELAKLINEDNKRNGDKAKLKEKMESELNELRNKIHLTIPGRRTKEQGEKLRREREFTHKELCQFLVSVSTGHFRLSIMRYYCDYPKDKK